MIPVSLLIALLIAFGIEPPAAGVPQADVSTRVLETFGGVTLIASLAFGLGFWVAFRASHIGGSTSRLRNLYVLGVRLITFLSLVVYGWIIHSVGWSKLVKTNWGLDGMILLDDVVVFLPYLVIQLLVWWGLFFAERALQYRLGAGSDRGLGRYMVLRGRQSLGLTLPVVIFYVVRRDVIGRFFPGWEDYAAGEPIEIAVVGLLVLSISPFFVRLAWPTYTLPDGPVRSRLEHAAGRVGFRYSDILVWDTGSMMVNACVTGILPWYRYVLLSDALLESLTPVETAAVFGHEIGHVAHRHFLYFAFFFLGSLGLLSIFGDALSQVGSLVSQVSWLLPINRDTLGEVIEGGTLLLVLGLYFWVVFGYLSRRLRAAKPMSTAARLFLAKPPFAPPISTWTTRPPYLARLPNLAFARRESAFLPTLSRVSRARTASTRGTAPGGTDRSPTGFRSSRAWHDIRSVKASSNAR